MGVKGKTGVYRFNELQKSRRKKLSDSDIRSMPSSYGEFQDHSSMKGHEFAEFQKRMYAENARERKRFRRIFWTIMAVVLIAIIYFLFFYEVGPIKSFKWPK